MRLLPTLSCSSSLCILRAPIAQDAVPRSAQDALPNTPLHRPGFLSAARVAAAKLVNRSPSCVSTAGRNSHLRLVVCTFPFARMAQSSRLDCPGHPLAAAGFIDDSVVAMALDPLLTTGLWKSRPPRRYFRLEPTRPFRSSDPYPILNCAPYPLRLFESFTSRRTPQSGRQISIA